MNRNRNREQEWGRREVEEEEKEAHEREDKGARNTPRNKAGVPAKKPAIPGKEAAVAKTVASASRESGQHLHTCELCKLGLHIRAVSTLSGACATPPNAAYPATCSLNPKRSSPPTSLHCCVHRLGY